MHPRESAQEATTQRSELNRPDRRLLPFLRAVTVACAGLFAHDTNADDRLPPLRAELRRLGSDVFDERQSGQRRAYSILMELSDEEGNLPQNAEQTVQTFLQSRDPEITGRIVKICDDLDRWRDTLPSRLTCPEGTYEDLRIAIEKTLGMPVRLEQPDSAQYLQTYYPGVRSALTLPCLKELCEATNCVPCMSADEMTLSVSPVSRQRYSQTTNLFWWTTKKEMYRFYTHLIRVF
jgi:hypothetical protein